MSGPTSDELIELVEKQDDLIDGLQSQLEMCKMEMMGLAANCREKEEQLKEAVDREVLLKKRLEELQIEDKNNSEDVVQKDLESLVELRLKRRELEFELEREKRFSKSREIQFDMEKSNLEQTVSEMKNELQIHISSEQQISAKLELALRHVAEWKSKFEGLSMKKDEEILRLESRNEIATQKELQLEEHIRQLGEDLTELRKEKMVLMARVSAMVEETGALRAKLLRISTAFPNGEQNNDAKDVQKLLSDQSHLISALREETKLLARKLEQDGRQFRQNIKDLKREKRELEKRLQNVLSV